MRKWDQLASLVGIAMGFILILSSLKYEIGKWHEPGPGFMPLGSGMLLLALCAAYGIQSTLTKSEDYRKRKSPWPRENRGRLVAVVLALFLLTFLLLPLGYLLSTFFLMICLFRVIEPERWFVTIFKSALSVLITYIAFEILLMVQFPKGFLGF